VVQGGSDSKEKERPIMAARKDINRRDFVRAGAALLAAPLAARGAATDPYRGLKVGVHSYSLRNFSLEQALVMTRELGLRYFGINPRHLALQSSPEQITEARRKIADAGLTLLATGVIGMSKDKEKTRRAFDYAKALGIKVIVCNPEHDSFDTLDALVEEYDMRLAIHNHGPGSLYSTPDDVLKAIKGHDPRIGACVDMGHFERSDVRAGDALRALKGHIYDIHLKDVDRRDKKGESVVMGTGVIDFEDVFKTLIATKCPWHVAMEYEADADNPLPGMEKSLEFARNVLAKL